MFLPIHQRTLKNFLYFLNLDRISTAIPIDIANNSQAEENEISKEDSSNDGMEKKKLNGRFKHICRKIAS